MKTRLFIVFAGVRAQAEIQTYLYVLIQHSVLKEITHCYKILPGVI